MFRKHVVNARIQIWSKTLAFTFKSITLRLCAYEIKNKLIVFMKKIGRDFDIEEKEWGMHVIDDILSNLFDLELILEMKFNYSNIIFDDFRNIDTLASAIILRWSNK